MLEKCVLTILELNWNQYLRHKKTKIARVVHTTVKQVISPIRKNENVFRMSKDEKCTCMQSVQKYCFSVPNMQICGVFVAVVVVVA